MNQLDLDEEAQQEKNLKHIQNLKYCFGRPVSTETIFILTTALHSSDQSEIDDVFRLFIETIYENFVDRSSNNKLSNGLRNNKVKTPEMLASIGIYLSIIMRYKPHTDLYVNDEHFLAIGFKVYRPYIPLYITFFLMISVIARTRLDLPVNKTVLIKSQEYKQESKQEIKLESKSQTSSPQNSPPQSSNVTQNAKTRRIQARIRPKNIEGIVDVRDYDTNNNQTTNNQTTNNQTTNNQTNSSQINQNKDDIGYVTVIEHLISQCPRDTPEHKLLSELKRNLGNGDKGGNADRADRIERIEKAEPNLNFLIPRLGLASQKQEMGIFLDMPDLIEKSDSGKLILSSDDILKCIYMQSNSILTTANDKNTNNDKNNMGVTEVKFTGEHFERAISCLNLPIARITLNYSDWIKPDTLDELTHRCKELKHAKCLELLLLAISKDVRLCKHQLKRIPIEWQESVIRDYTISRWKLTKTPFHDISVTNNNNSTLGYYRTHLCTNESDSQLRLTLEKLSEAFKDETDRKLFVENVKTMNKSYFILESSNYTDFKGEGKLSMANTEDTMLNDIFDISRNFIVSYREGDKIYLFDYGLFPTLLEKRENPYNRQPINSLVLQEIERVHHRYRHEMGLSVECTSITDFVDELVEGRHVVTNCSCVKNYKRKLLRELKDYGVKEESFEWINLDDIIMKFGLISLEYQADTVDELCAVIYKSLKIRAGSFHKDEIDNLQATIASIILLYSKPMGSFILNI